VLSGLGADGTEGVKAIKKTGGLVLVSDPEKAAFGSMPANAIATGIVDFVLQPALMPAAIEEYINKNSVLAAADNKEKEECRIIIRMINEQLPLDFSEYKQGTILRRIKRRAANYQCDSLEKYIEVLKEKPVEIKALVQDFLISVTSFFRDAKTFECVQTEILPALYKNLGEDEELKIWVPGCATGEEAYSFAILIHEQMEDGLHDAAVKIFATDIDNLALMQAGKGIYSAGIARDVSAKRLNKYFIQEGNSYRIKPQIRKMVIFSQHNLSKNPPFCNMHIISCRNMLIYMTTELQKKIFSILIFGLRQHGYLILGSSENPTSILQHLEVVNKKAKIYKNLEVKRRMNFDGFSVPEIPSVNLHRDNLQNADIKQLMYNSLSEAVNSVFFNSTSQLVVCVDENNNVVKSYGDTGKFLLQKNFTLNLLELMPRPLAVAFNMLSLEVKKTGEKAFLNAVEMPLGDAVISVNVTVDLLKLKAPFQKFLMVTFSEAATGSVPLGKGIAYNEEKYFEQYTLNLEEELTSLKEKLKYTQGQLDASNENMQSYNEELLSANEELQSTNEEMQSVNEELHTVNADYQLKNNELQEVNDDLNNYFKSNINGQLVVSDRLLLLKFSPGAVKQINLQPGDIGRPLTDISTNIKFETITDDISKVIKDGSIISKEIETTDGKWYQVLTMPYTQQSDLKNTGAIITFNDVTALKLTQLELDKKNEVLKQQAKDLNISNHDLQQFAYTASHDLEEPMRMVSSFLALLKKRLTGHLDEKSNQYFSFAIDGADRMRKLIADLLEYCKVGTNKEQFAEVDLEATANYIKMLFRSKMAVSNGTITFSPMPVITANNTLITQLFSNLIGNAFKYAGNKAPVIEVGYSENDFSYTFFVKDHGIGIASKDHDRIFEMFQRLPQHSNGAADGTGIGLALCKKIVETHQGKIWVSSEEGQGSTFYFIIPKKTAA